MKQISIIGHLGKDAELVNTENKEYQTVMFNVAVSETFKDNNGEEKTNTDWITCFKRYKNAENVLPILKKGIKVYAYGKPSFGINNHNNAVYVAITLNVRDLEFMTKQEEPKKEAKK